MDAAVAYSEMVNSDDDRKLTRRQRAIVGFWKYYVLRTGYPPSYEEIAAGVGLKTRSGVGYQVQQLAQMGYISRSPGRARATSLLAGGPDEQPVIQVPIVGRIAAGAPVLSHEHVEGYFPMPQQLVGKGQVIALRVAGDSMIDAGINDGDLVFVRLETDVENGDIVAALLPSEAASDYEGTVKRLRKRDGHVWLVPENPRYQPFLGDDAWIIGKVVGTWHDV
jgi:repressor LexA